MSNLTGQTILFLLVVILVLVVLYQWLRHAWQEARIQQLEDDRDYYMSQAPIDEEWTLGQPQQVGDKK